MKDFIKRLVVTALLSMVIVASSNASELEVNKAIDKVNFDEIVLNICISNQSYCRILTDKWFYSFLKKNYKAGLKTIAKIESQFKYKRGIYDLNDISLFQINRKVWTQDKLRKYGLFYSYYSIRVNTEIAAKVALTIWLVNICQYISNTGRYYPSIDMYIPFYHRSISISSCYHKKVKKVIWKYVEEYNRKEEL